MINVFSDESDAKFRSLCDRCVYTGAAKEGDSGRGWKVKSYTTQGFPKQKILYCEYNGVFRLKPQTNDYRSCGTTKKNSKYLTSNSLKCSNDGVQLLDFTQSRRQKWSIKQASAPSETSLATYNIIEDKGKNCNRVYLSAPESTSASDDYETPSEPVELELSRNSKWQWNIRGQDMANGEIDCLKVDLSSKNQFTYINVNQECNEFLYDSDIGDWELIPASS